MAIEGVRGSDRTYGLIIKDAHAATPFGTTAVGARIAARLRDRRAEPAREQICSGMRHAQVKIDDGPRRAGLGRARARRARACPGRSAIARDRGYRLDRVRLSRRAGRRRGDPERRGGLERALSLRHARAHAARRIGDAVGVLVGVIVIAAGVQKGKYGLDGYGARAGQFLAAFPPGISPFCARWRSASRRGRPAISRAAPSACSMSRVSSRCSRPASPSSRSWSGRGAPD